MGVDAWWAQGVTVGYERITGLRLAHQRPNGTFTADKSKTVTVEASWLREMLPDDTDRRDLFGGEPSKNTPFAPLWIAEKVSRQG